MEAKSKSKTKAQQATAKNVTHREGGTDVFIPEQELADFRESESGEIVES